MHTVSQLKPLVLCFIASSTLVACGGGSKAKTDSQADNKDPQAKPLGDYALVKAGSKAAFAQYLKVGLRNGVDKKKYLLSSGKAGAESESDGSASSSSFGVSSTNLIEAGVDEADFAKQNASHIYTTSLGVKNNFINVYTKPSTKKSGTLSISAGDTKGFFIKASNLYALQQTSRSEPAFGKNGFKNAKLALDAIDISTPTSPSIRKTYTWEGVYETSRRIGNSIYVVSKTNASEPWACIMNSAVVRAGASESKNTSAFRIDPSQPAPYCGKPEALTAEQIAERMPVDITGRKIKPEQCYIPKSYKAKSSGINTSMTLITKVDLSGKEQHQTTCVAASAQHVYMTPRSLYFSGTDYNYSPVTTKESVQKASSHVLPAQHIKENTIINKFNLSDGSVTYAGTGKVPGYINWSAPGFSMNEHKGVLRVVTSASQPKGQVLNMLHTLKEDGAKKELSNMATLPNAKQPKAIGKPGERVQGMRFFGDEGYIVTFKNTDPLYKIDLANPAKPTIKGELELPGYSAYLHPISDRYLLGVGFNANEKGNITGLQTTVFDTSSDNPTIADQATIIKGKGEHLILPVANDSRAITTLNSGTTTRVAFPYKISGWKAQLKTHTNQLRSLEYTIDTTTGKFTAKASRNLTKPLTFDDIRALNLAGKQKPVYRHNFYHRTERALMSGDDLYYSIFDGSLTKHTWGQSN